MPARVPFSFDARAPAFVMPGLGARLDLLRQGFEARGEPRLSWDMPASPSLLPDLAPAAAEAVAAIVAEMLANALRHAHASRVAVRVAVDEGTLRITVRDNGRGAPAAAFHLEGMHGIEAMQARALRLGGRIAIHSTPGHGATFALVVPVFHD